MLAFLACTAPQAHSRDKLTTLLWGSHFEAQARQNLRQALSRLRRALGEDALVSAGELVSLRPGVIACDVARFEALLADGSRDALIGAVGLYKGGLLADIASRRRPGRNGSRPNANGWKGWRSMPWSSSASRSSRPAITSRR